jgi:hypothetical protein
MSGPRGGDVSGTTRIDVTMGEAIPVAKSSFDPGYDLGNSLEYCNQADLTRGYSDNGKAVGE